jgi:hypothetical protein
MHLLIMFFGPLFSFLQQLPDWKNLDEVIQWVIAGGSAIMVSALFAFLAENFVWWQKLTKNVKLIISLVLTIGIGALAYYLSSLPELISFVQPYWAIVVMMVLAWLSSQVTYAIAKFANYGAKARAAALEK